METTIDYTTFQSRVNLLTQINATNEKEVAERYKEEDTKLCHVGERILLAYAKSSIHPEKGTLLFRATPPDWDDFDKTNFVCFSYPKEQATKLNRCNLPCNPIFYCSSDMSVCLNEILQNKKKKLTFPLKLYVSQWVVEKEIEWKILPFVFGDLLPSNPAYEYGQKNKKQLFEKYQQVLDPKDIKDYIAFYNRTFLEKECFKFSSLVSHKFIYEDNGDIVFYPSLQFSEGNNYAVNPKLINNNSISLQRVYELQIEKVDDGHILEVLSVGYPKGLKISWN